MKAYLAHDPINGEHEEFETIEEAREFLEESFLDSDEGYHPDASTCRIYKLIETVKMTVVDEKSNYKYDSEDDVPENDETGDFWPHLI
jgi:hypothetical protein